MPATLTTRAFQVRQHAGLTKVPGSFTKPEALPDAAPQPSIDNDLFGRMNIEQNISATDGPVVTFDVIPDIRYIILYFTFFISKMYKDLEQRDQPMLSPASMMAYCLGLVYAHCLTCDRYIRIKPSSQAKAYLDDPDRKKFHSVLLNCYVPPFVKQILDILTPTNDPRRPGIEYIPTYAGWNAQIDAFVAAFPISIFTKFHDTCARSRTNAEPQEIINQWLSFLPSQQINVAHYFGVNIDINGTASTYENWLYQAVISLMNPVVSRFLGNRPVLAHIPTATFDSTINVNNEIYTHILMADIDNIDEATKFFKTFSTIAQDLMSANIQLGACYDQLVGTTILTHCVSEPSLPTYHWRTTKTGKSDTVSEISHKKYAESIKWLTKKKHTAPSASMEYPKDVKGSVQYLLRLVNANYKASDDKDIFIEFNPRMHVTPRQRIFDPYDYSATKAAYPIVAGLRIESFELDGFEVPNVNLRSSLQEENAQCLQACIPSSKFFSHFSSADVQVVQRALSDENNQKQSLSFYDMSRNRVANLPLDAMNPGTSLPVDSSTVPMDWTYITNKFSWLLGSSDQPCPIGNKFIVGWSSYRFVPKSKPLVKMTADDVHVLMSFRPMFGTNVTLFEVEHGSRTIPRA